MHAIQEFRLLQLYALQECHSLNYPGVQASILNAPHVRGGGDRGDGGEGLKTGGGGGEGLKTNTARRRVSRSAPHPHNHSGPHPPTDPKLTAREQEETCNPFSGGCSGGGSHSPPHRHKNSPPLPSTLTSREQEEKCNTFSNNLRRASHSTRYSVFLLY